jgi:hypothetical protein
MGRSATSVRRSRMSASCRIADVSEEADFRLVPIADVLTRRLCLGEFPGAVQDLGPRLVEADHVVPASFDRQAIGDLAVATAELDINGAVGSFPQN